MIITFVLGLIISAYACCLTIDLMSVLLDEKFINYLRGTTLLLTSFWSLAICTYCLIFAITVGI